MFPLRSLCVTFHVPIVCEMTKQHTTTRHRPAHGQAAFSLLELMAAIAIFTIVMVLLASIASHVQDSFRFVKDKSSRFRAARTAFESMKSTLAQATLNPYWDYDNPAQPTAYKRQSELRFIIGASSELLPAGIQSTTQAVFFQTPSGSTENTAQFNGMNNLLNTIGFYIEFTSDSSFRPSVIHARVKEKHRFRLMQLIEPSDNLTIYRQTSGVPAYAGLEWFRIPLQERSFNHVLADNIIGLFVRALDPDNATLTPDFSYSTAPDAPEAQRHQLPPYLEITIVAIDEDSASRLEARDGTSMPDLIPSGLFTNASNAQFQSDLESLAAALDADPLIDFEIYTSSVAIKSSKWSR